MTVLLDTSAFIWLCSDPDQFPPDARRVLSSKDLLMLFISDATILEIKVKSTLGKLEFPMKPTQWIEEQCGVWDISVIPVTSTEICASAKISAHIKDPFDPLIIATAHTLSLPIITHEESFKDFGVDVIW